MANVTIRDVAREAGVSISTVSNALNNVDVLSPETKVRVLEAAKKLNYIPNLNGRLLKARGSKMIGFFTSTMAGPYIYVFVETLCRECEKHGYGINIFFSSDRELIMNNLLGQKLAGVIIYEDELIGQREMDILRRREIKTLFVDREAKGQFVSSLIFDSWQAGYEAASYLISLGHKNIVYISGPDTVYDNIRRFDGYRTALAEAGIRFEDAMCIKGYFEEEYTYNSVKTLLRTEKNIHPDAFLAANDMSAIGCMKALQDMGISVPEDISVMGFDDIDIAKYLDPPLTTVRNPIALQGIKAVNMLMELINQGRQGYVAKLDSTLVIRNSCIMKK